MLCFRHTLNHPRPSKLLIALCCALSCLSVRRLEANEKPNIVLILADDMGVGDVKCFGKDLSRAETPHIDRLAREGMMFTDAHAPVAHCIPTRVAIMTGRYKFRFQGPKKFGPWGFLYPQFPPNHLTLAEILGQSGYYSGYIGKWHLGLEMATTDRQPQGPGNVDFTQPIRQGPNDRGFDESFILPGSLDMYPYVFARNQKWQGKVTAQKGWSAFNRVGPAEKDFEDYKVLDTFSTEAEKFIAAQSKTESPFFLFVALTAPHTPTSPSPKFRGKSKLGLYGDFLMETDDCVGRVLRALRETGADQNTLVLFTSDHGAANYAGNIAKATHAQHKSMEKLGHHSNGRFRGHKFSAYEGGTRVPLVARWPGKTPASSECKQIVGLNDLLATVADVTDTKIYSDAAPDSFSFGNLLLTPHAKPNREFMICRSSNAFTIRQGDWKLCLCPGSGCGGTWGNEPKRMGAWKKAVEQWGRSPTKNEIRKPVFCQLFNLRSDPEERHDLSSKFPDKINELGALLDKVIASGRSTPGPRLKNDRTFSPIQDVPRFVFSSN